MRIVSIDTETTGLNPDKSLVIQVGAVIFDTSDTKLHIYGSYNKYIPHNDIIGSPQALIMNIEHIKNIEEYCKKVKYINRYKDSEENDIINTIREYELIVEKMLIEENDFSLDFHTFLNIHDGYYIYENRQKLNVAGKNYWQFDHKFLSKINDFNKLIKPSHRSIEVATLWINDSDLVPPSLNECKKRAIEFCKTLSDPYYLSLFPDDMVTHDALEDALDVAKLIWLGVRKQQHLL